MMEETAPVADEVSQLDKGKLRTAQIILGLINASAVGVGIYWVIHPIPTYQAYLYYLIFPVIALVAYRSLGDYALLMNHRREKRFGVFFALVFPAIFLVMDANQKHDILDYTSLIIPTVLLGCLFFLAIVIKNKKFNTNSTEGKMNLCGAGIVSLLLGYGLALLYNFSAVSTLPEDYESVIRNKYIETLHSRNGTYYHYHFVVKPWKYNTTPDDLRVSPDTYNHLNDNDTVQIEVCYGMLHVPWYRVHG
jgi:hypothetical protein